MIMLKRAAKILIVILLLLEASIIGIAMLPFRTVTADTLEHDVPVVFVDPQNITADVGETFTISVKVFNLTANYFWADLDWPRNPLPLVPGGRYKYPLGYLYGIDLEFNWDPTLLEYKSHSVRVPVETYADGILHQPVYNFKDNVTATDGTYRIVQMSLDPAPWFNCPNANATLFTMTFTVKKAGKCALSLDQSDLATDFVHLPQDFLLQHEIPHWTKNSQFQTSQLLTRIESVNAGTLLQGTLYDPVISGEDVTIQVVTINDGTIEDTYNLTLYSGTTLLYKWENRTLDPDENETLSYTVTNPDLGAHTITANATILHGTDTFTDEMSEEFTVVDTPLLVIEGPDSAKGGETVSFSASTSSHSDSNSHIKNYKWFLWVPSETLPNQEVNNSTTAEFVLPTEIPEEKLGNWTVILVVTDSNGITAQPATGTTLKPDSTLLRPSAEPYRELKTLHVGKAEPLGFFSLENIALIVVLVVIIALAVVYLRRRSR